MKFRDKVPSSSSNYLKLTDGESATGVFMGEIHDFFQLWVKDSTGKKVSKEVPEGTADAKFRFKVNFVTKEDGKYVPKIFESGADNYRRLKTIHEKFGALPDTLVEITRHGTELNTKYDLMPLKGAVSPEAKQTKLLNLKYQEKRETNQSWANDDTDQNEFATPPDQSQFAEEDTLPF